jgi:hypothetical protein
MELTCSSFTKNRICASAILFARSNPTPRKTRRADKAAPRDAALGEFDDNPLRSLDSRKRRHLDFIAADLDFGAADFDFVAAGLDSIVLARNRQTSAIS